MQFNHPEGLIAVILGVISFYGMTYVVVALNVGWRFGYWVTSATFGALMVLLSIFWIITPVGPLGDEAHWVAAGADTNQISAVSLEDTTYSETSSYPSGPWFTPEEAETRLENFESAMGNCLSASIESLSELERESCETAQSFMPPEEEIPFIDGTLVIVQSEFTDVRFAEEQGATLAQAQVLPITHDPRVAEDPEAGELMGEPFLIAAVWEEGTFRQPAVASMLIFLLWTAVHLFGLHRAEERKLSPVA